MNLNDLFRKYDAGRKTLAGLPFEEKIRIVVKLQKRAAALRPEFHRIVWQLEEEPQEDQQRAE